MMSIITREFALKAVHCAVDHMGEANDIHKHARARSVECLQHAIDILSQSSDEAHLDYEEFIRQRYYTKGLSEFPRYDDGGPVYGVYKTAAQDAIESIMYSAGIKHPDYLSLLKERDKLLAQVSEEAYLDHDDDDHNLIDENTNICLSDN